MKRAFLVAAMTVGLLCFIVRAEGDEAAVLTVIGAVSKTNRGAFDTFHDAFFKYHDRTFERAFAFDRNALGALPQATVTARAEGWSAAVRATGPRLKDVLAAAGVAETATVTAFALDGYGVEFTPAERAAHDWILAIDINGTPLGLGGRGPAWVLYDTGAGVATGAEEEAWVWSVFLLSAE